MTEASTDLDGRVPRRQLVVGGIVFAIVLAALIAGYAIFLRSGYVVLADGLRPTETATIVAELDKRGTAYKLRDGGTTVLVADGEVDTTRVAIAGSDAAATGQTGFELFNKSDMGLTNFAQKINYQRALQGELVRTIMLMDGVESARVHLALPERALFRDDRAEPSAAVTIAMKAGQVADPARVAGIQRLVAASVPELPAGKVIVLDSDGRLISGEASSTPSASAATPDIEERTAVEQYYHARARAAIEQAMPGIKAAVRVAASPTEGLVISRDARWTPSGDAADRNFRLQVTVLTVTALNGEDRGIANRAILSALALDAARGDSLSFETGPVDLPLPTAAPTAPALAPVTSATSAIDAPAPVLGDATPGAIGWALSGAAIVGLLALLLRIRARPALSSGEHEAFAQTLRRQLALHDAEREEFGNAAP